MTSPRPPASDPHQPFEELAVGHALSALEPQEQARFTEHLRSCARCEQAVAEHAVTLAQMAHAAPQVEPPPSLLEGIRAGVRAEPRRGGAARAVPPPPLGSPATDELDQARRRRSAVQVQRSHLLVAAAAVASLVLGLGGWNAVLQRDLDQQAETAGRLAAAVQALESPGTRTVRLTSPEGEVLAVALLQDEQISLVVDGLAPTDEDSVYVLWGQARSGDVRPVGTFDVSRQGLDVLEGLRLDPALPAVTTLMVTREQGRTPPATTTQPVLVSGAV